ncbi:MAG: adenylosuccinate synthase [Spirochaetales bacterium]|nr:adenylosuccinate synthase [Spirochaetales bacterium]
MNLVVIGAQWGDEGKGKIVDFLAEEADIVVRYSGGANAGHTVVIGDQTYKLHLIPSGVLSPATRAVLGIGMVVDLENLFEELAMLEAKGIVWNGRVLLSDRAHLVLPRYRQMDRERDAGRRVPLGTTGRGIGIAYALKAYREGIRVGDLFDPEVWGALSPEDREYLDPFRERIEPMVVDVSRLMYESRGRNVLFEGAQGTLLDLDLGTYPFVSSGISCAAGAAIGGGVGPQEIHRVIGVFKAYSTRVGSGPFPSEFRQERDGNLGEVVREIGREYGVTTGRPRRCGYLDLVSLRYACRSNRIDALSLTHLDVYDLMDEVQACVAYRLRDGQSDEFPASITALQEAEPVLKRFPGWKRPITDCRREADLPPQARDYVRFIEEYTETPVEITSVGCKRDQTMVRRDPWTRS